MNNLAFDYYEAFSRNIGFVTPGELFELRKKKVAIAGMGGVGGLHLLTLTRLGVGKFNIADFDKFELGNFNRQVGANMTTINKAKTEVMAKQALDINPELEIQKFDQGLTDANIDDFLQNVDLYVDGLDVLALETRRAVFMKCHKQKIPCITVAPVGMGFSLINFLPEKMSFDQYWQFKNQLGTEKLFKFLRALVPTDLHRPSLIYERAFDFEHGRAASTPMGCHLTTGIMGTEALKILLKRGKVLAAPHSIHYDGYTYKIKKTYLWRGTENPILKLKLFLAKLLGLT